MAQSVDRKNSGQFNWVSGTAAAAGLVVLAIGATWGVHAIQAQIALSKAESQIAKGYYALAAATLAPYQSQLSGRKRGCETLVNAHFGAKHAEPLELVAQACLDAGIETSTIDVGLAASYEFAGKDQQALEVLNQAVQHFPGSPDAYYRMAQIFQRNKNAAMAADAVFKAAERADNPKITLEALQVLSEQGRWTQARRAAEMLKNATTEDPEVRLLMARALLRGGDKEGAKTDVDQARELLAKKPELKGKLEASYADMLAVSQSSPQAAPSRKVASH